MAKENYIRLRGQLRSDVAYLKDKDGNIVTAIFPLLVIRREAYDRAGNLTPKWDRPIIATSDPLLIRKAQTFKKHNIIDVKGTFRTQHSRRKQDCPHCGTRNIVECVLATINPVYLGVVENRITNDTDGMQYLVDCAEVANEAKVIGRVCTPTERIAFGETDRGEVFARYQLAVNRKLYIPDSMDEEDHTDYPMVYSYGNVAEDDLHILQQNTLVFIDGYIHTMNYDQPVVCESCGEEFTFKSQKMNLTPYSMEYLRDYEELKESTHTKNDEIQEQQITKDGVKL